ncbi:MAG: protein kinase, partial [Anaerolineales bacterium]|nr:protein kinase [Anaerolineales bacterium]
MIGQQIEQYRIETLLGKGGLGSVYRAQDINLTRPVAIKVIYPHFTNQHTYHDHILREAKTAARLTHPSIATIYNFEHNEHTLYIVMEYVPGQSLAG